MSSPLTESPPPAGTRLADIIAGVSIAGLLIPEAVAYSGVANMPPQAGVIALFAGLLCYGALGSSRFAIVSATSSSAALLAATLASMGGSDAALRMAIAGAIVLAAGIGFILACLAKFGDVSAFISKPVLRGFSIGLALTIALKQLPKMVGYHPEHSDFLRFCFELFSHLTRWNWAGLGLGATSLAILFILSRNKRIPAALLVIALGIAIGQLAHLSQYGIEEVGHFALSLPPPTLPVLSYQQWLRVGELSMAVVLVLYAESYSSIRTYALKYGDNTSPNRDLLALGAANVVSGLFNGLAVGAGFSATSANEAAGAQSRLSGLFAALIAGALVLTVLPLISLTPEPVLASIVIFAVSHALNPKPLKQYFIWRRDRIVVCVAIAGVILLGVLDGLLLGIAISLMMALREFSQAAVLELGHIGDGYSFIPVKRHPEAQPIPSLMILRPEAPMFFANTDRVSAEVLKMVDLRNASPNPPIHNLIISLEESPNLDGTSIEGLRQLAEKLGKEGITLTLARVRDSAMEVLTANPVPALPASSISGVSIADTVEKLGVKL